MQNRKLPNALILFALYVQTTFNDCALQSKENPTKTSLYFWNNVFVDELIAP